MRVMRAEQKQNYRDTEEELFRRSVLIAIVDLFPHIQVVVCPGIEFKRNPPNPMEHEERPEHVTDVSEGPRCFLRHAWYDVVENLQDNDKDEVNCPCTLRKRMMLAKSRESGHSAGGPSVKRGCCACLWR